MLFNNTETLKFSVSFYLCDLNTKLKNAYQSLKRAENRASKFRLSFVQFFIVRNSGL